MATTGLKRSRRFAPLIRGFPRLASLTVLSEQVGQAAWRLIALLARAAPDVLAIEFLLACTAFLFRDALLAGLVFHEADTSTMFYPVFAALWAALRRGELLLWSPELFSGFPLLAEGQTGVLYPPNWLVSAWLTPQEGFIWLRVIHFALAACFSYLFGRSLRLAPAPAVVIALSFSFGSFMIGQLQHGSVIASAIWLPLVLALTELGFRSRGPARLRMLVLAGLALGASALGVHVQTVVMAGGCFVAWVLFRMVLPPPPLGTSRALAGPPSQEGSARPSGDQVCPSGTFRWRRGLVGSVTTVARQSRLGSRCMAALGDLGAGIWCLLLVPLVGMAVSAPQLLPLLELSGESGRAGSWSYQLATDYSLPVQNLVTLVFPFFFRGAQGGAWSLWQPWEVTYYAGAVPLALAVLALAFVRRREVLFFAVLVAGATLLALGDYSLLNVYAHVWDWPGVNLTRAPARFSYLGVLGIAVLAGFGVQALWENLQPGVRARGGMRLLGLWMAGLLALLGVIVWHLVTWRHWLEAEPFWALKVLDEQYLALRRDPGVVDSAQKVYAGLWRSLDLTNPQTALPLVLLGLLLLLVVCWNEFRRARLVWRSLLVLLVAADVLTFAHEFHPLRSIDEVADIAPAGVFLASQEGPFRVYTTPDVRQPRPNKLLPWDIAEVKAYDPLELSRHRVFIGSVDHVDNWLFDLLGVRYRLSSVDSAALPSYRQTGFNPQHPLLSGTLANPSGREAWSIPPDFADELRVVSVLQDSFGIADGEQVAEWVLTDVDGNRLTIPMLAGRDTADWTYDDPLYSARPAHRRARVAFTFDLPFPLPQGGRYVSLYYSAFPLPSRPRVVHAELRSTHPVGRIQLYGFAFLNHDRAPLAQFFPSEKYDSVFEGGGVVIQENRAAFPRAFAVPEGIVAGSSYEALDLLAHGPIQPRRQVVLETGEAATEWLALPAPRVGDDRLGAPYGEVEIVEYRNERVTVQVETDGGYLVLADAFYPGWRAYVDGNETPVLRADYLFRAVQLPPGDHTVEFRYEPASFATGAQIGRLALALSALALLATLARSLPAGRSYPLRVP